MSQEKKKKYTGKIMAHTLVFTYKGVEHLYNFRGPDEAKDYFPHELEPLKEGIARFCGTDKDDKEIVILGIAGPEAKKRLAPKKDSAPTKGEMQKYLDSLPTLF